LESDRLLANCNTISTGLDVTFETEALRAAIGKLS